MKDPRLGRTAGRGSLLAERGGTGHAKAQPYINLGTSYINAETAHIKGETSNING